MTDATMTTAAAPTTQVRAPFTLDSFKDIFDGKVCPPNLKDVDLSDGVASLCLSGWQEATGRLLVPGATYATWARYYLGTTQGGALDGRGYVIWSGYGPGPMNAAQGRVSRFALCVHQPVEGAGANHMRGWHPARCAKCGLDMSVDSGD